MTVIRGSEHWLSWRRAARQVGRHFFLLLGIACSLLMLFGDSAHTSGFIERAIIVPIYAGWMAMALILRAIHFPQSSGFLMLVSAVMRWLTGLLPFAILDWLVALLVGQLRRNARYRQS